MRIIAVDDEKNALDILVRAIEEAVPEAEVFEFTKASTALQKLNEGNLYPDIAFLDIEMPGIGGIELARKMKLLRPKTWIVFVTGFSQYALEAYSLHAKGYIMKPVTTKMILDEIEEPCPQPLLAPTKKRIRVQTFGNFEVYVDGNLVHFSRSKAKEMFAYLVHRKGAGITAKELFAVLFEDKPYGKQQQDYLQKISQSMVKAFTDVNADYVIIKSYNSMAVNTEELDCDRYRFDELETEAINAYNGEYMSQYEWAEYSIGYMDQIKE